MRLLFKWGIRLLLGAGLIVGLIGLLAFIVLRQTLPPNSAEMNLAGLSSPVSAVFDRDAVPHITADSFDDASKVMGFIHARDRLWQMEVLRMAGQGRLSEMFGEATLGSDRFLRTLGMADASRKSFEKLQPDTQSALQAYAEGVNAYVTRKTKMLEPALGAEFLILGHKPEQWEPWQSVLVIKVMGLTLSGNMDHEITRLSLALKGFSSAEIEDLIPYGPKDNPSRLPDLKKLYGFEEKAAKVMQPSAAPQQAASNSHNMDWPTGQSASNNWVISGSRTESGKPILANDPHLGFTAPSTFYLAHLSWEEEGNRRNVIGGTIPGVPFVIAGRNDTLAWGLTTTNLDAQDLFLEKIDENAGTYKTANGSADLSITETEIRYGKGQSEALNIRYTNNGVLLPDGYKGIGDVLPDGYGLALKWPGLASDDTTLDLLFINNRAKTVREFIAGGKYGISPMQSVVVADTSGNIGLVAKARSPRRKPENTINGRAPVPGWLDEYQWNGYVPDWQMLAVINPTEGALATANANFLPKDFKEHITYDWAEHFRQERAENLVVKRNSEHTMSVSKEIIADTHSPAMIKLRDLANRIMPAGVGDIQELREQLGEWNGKMEAEQPEPIIMLAWFRHLNINLFKDDLGDLFNKFERGRLTRIIGVLERSGSRDWCDDKTTAATESCADILEKSFDAAIKELKAEYGEDWRSWEYGAAHMAHFEHRPFGQVGALASYFNISVRSSGGPYTLRRGQTKFQFDKPYLNRHGAAFRGIYDLNDLDKSLYIQSTGQSGNFLSPHYDSLAKRWAAMDYLQMSTKPADYEKEAIGTWSFNP